jgi:hypothetical protein
MTGGSEREGGGPHGVREDDEEHSSFGDGLTQDRDVNNLLNAIAAMVRADEAQARDIPDDLVPALSEGERDKLTALIVGEQSQERSSISSPQEASSVVTAARRRRTGWVQRRPGIAATGGVLLLAAAAVSLWLRPAERLSPLPTFSVSASGGVAEMRGPASETAGDSATTALQNVGGATELRITCRPVVAATGPVSVRVLFVQNQISNEIHPSIRVAPTGAAEIRVRGSELIGRYRGRGDLRVLIGRPAAVSEDRAGADDLRTLIVPIDLLPTGASQ